MLELRIEPSWLARLKRAARLEHMAVSDLVRRWVRPGVERIERKHRLGT